MANRLANWGKAQQALPSKAEPDEGENTGLKRFLFGRGKTKDSESNAAAQKAANARVNPRPTLTTERLNASLGSGGRGGVPGRAAGISPQLMAEQAKAGDKQVAREAAEKQKASNDKIMERLAAKGARTRELTHDEWATLNPKQQQQVQFNSTLLDARATDQAAGNTSATEDLLRQMNLDEGVVSKEEFAAGVTAIRESDLFSKGPVRGAPETTADRPGSRTFASVAQEKLAPAPTWSAASDPAGRAKLISTISAGVEQYFSQLAPSMESDALSSVLGTTSVSTGSSQTDQALSEIYEAAARKSTWDSGASYDQLMEALAGVQIAPEVFAQYAGERAATAERTGIPLIDDAEDSLDVAAFRTALGLKEN